MRKDPIMRKDSILNRLDREGCRQALKDHGFNITAWALVNGLNDKTMQQFLCGSYPRPGHPGGSNVKKIIACLKKSKCLVMREAPVSNPVGLDHAA